MKRRLILGGPGSGKTERLMSLLDGELSSGVAPERIAFVSFTKAAVEEASSRFSQKFRLAQNRMPYFRTLHSLCYRQLGLRRDQVLDTWGLRKFGASIGVKITGSSSTEEAPTIEGDRMIFLIGLARATGRYLRDVWDEHGGVDWTTLKWFDDSLTLHKRSQGKMDFADMIIEYVDQKAPRPDVSVAVIDEAQDLTAAQWRVVDRAFRDADRMYLAGDDDQVLYEWAGADLEKFRSINVDDSEVLPKSHRMPPEIFALAEEVSSRIENRYPKEWASADHDGKIHHVSEVPYLDLSKGQWLLLARNTYLLEKFVAECQNQGVPYRTRSGPSVDPEDIQVILDHERTRKGQTITPERQVRVNHAIGSGDRRKIWHECFEGMPLSKRAYYLTMLRSGEDLKAQPRIRIDTIHGAKGLEAENVVLLTDVSPKSWEESQTQPDAENRVLYVGVSRSARNLFLISPQSAYFFDI